jgi:unsaturated rhamnogalacturonyl hydrolase
MWHTVMDDTASYPESSATMMFAYGLLKLHRLGVLPASVKPMALKAWQVVNRRYVKDGVVTGVSFGTVPNGKYKVLPVGTKSWGTGAYLMAGSEVDRAFGKK